MNFLTEVGRIDSSVTVVEELLQEVQGCIVVVQSHFINAFLASFFPSGVNSFSSVNLLFFFILLLFGLLLNLQLLNYEERIEYANLVHQLAW